MCAGTSSVSVLALATAELLLGLGDGGAHVDLICDAGYPSFLLSYWVRERPRGTIPLEQAIAILTSEPADVYGLRDRGLIAPGKPTALSGFPVVGDLLPVGRSPLGERASCVVGGRPGQLPLG